MYRLHEDVEVQGVYNELMDMTAEEARNEMISRIRMMTSGERAEFAVELYEMDLIDRKYARELLGISEESICREQCSEHGILLLKRGLSLCRMTSCLRSIWKW